MKTNLKTKLWTLLLACSLGTAARAEGLVTVNRQSSADLVERLLGDGVTASNIVFKGAADSAGTFSGGTGIIGFEDGIVLSSGSIQNVVGPNRQDGISTQHVIAGDPQLDTLVPGFSTRDATVLEFDFVPDRNVITFQYVFASEEYNEYVNSRFNDVFGFFINGVNIALLPGTNVPVSINTVNGGYPIGTNASNPTYYINNDLNSRIVSINTEMDGLTVVLTVQATVNPNVVNHIKLAVADTDDYVLDSNVFLKTNSFTTRPVTPPPPANNAPVANAGADQTVTASGATAMVHLDGSQSTDADGDELSYEWFKGEEFLAKGVSARIFLPVGTHTITLQVTDLSGATAEDDVIVTVNQAPVVEPPTVPPTTVPLTTPNAKVTGGGTISTETGGAHFSLVAQAGQNGELKGNLNYLVSATGKTIRSTAFTAIVVEGTHARIFGKATVNGTGNYDYVADVDDLGERGVNDTFRIEVKNVYSSGPIGGAKLSGGNIQIHKIK